MSVRPILRGLCTYVPIVSRYVASRTGGTVSARYCYSVWARHLMTSVAHGLSSQPSTVAELGPGDSLGIGLAALISGSERYLALDVVNFASADRNIRIFDELLTLFRARADIPGPDEFPKVKPALPDYAFPGHIFTEERMRWALDDDRLARIRRSIIDPRGPDSMIDHRIPWYDARVIQERSVDMIYSQAVLEHVDDLENTYRAMNLWLKPQGHMSHQIDFKCHYTADQWNGHWAHSDFTWRVIRGRQAYLLNRQALSDHRRLLAESGFCVVCEQKVTTESHLARKDLAPRFASLSDEDLTTSGVYILAVGQA